MSWSLTRAYLIATADFIATIWLRKPMQRHKETHIAAVVDFVYADY